MNKELSIGMYVRTKCGLIAKVQSINEYNIALMNTCCERQEDIYFTFPNEEKIYEIVKSSFNIIDLIEVGDYVNGYKVKIPKCQYYDAHDSYYVDCENKIYINSKDIKSILTHEQYESVEYEV